MADNQEERARRDEQIRETIMAKLIESGEKDRIKEMLRDRLMQCGYGTETLYLLPIVDHMLCCRSSSNDQHSIDSSLIS